MKNKIIFIVSLFICLLVPVCSYAQDYGNQIPSNFNISGGAYIEVQTNLGRGVLLFPESAKKDVLCFVGNGYNLFNPSNSTITGRFYINNVTYQARFSGYSSCQYYDEFNTSVTSRTWRDLTISQIYNTNVELTDNIKDRGNTIEIFDIYQWTMFGLIGFLLFLLVVLILKIARA